MALPDKSLTAGLPVAAGEFQSADERDMTRMGRVQQLKVSFSRTLRMLVLSEI